MQEEEQDREDEMITLVLNLWSRRCLQDIHMKVSGGG